MWAALLVLVSLATFVGTKIFKMVTETRRIDKLHGVLIDPNNKLSKEILLERLAEVELAGHRKALMHHRVWQIAALVSVGTGLGGAAILALAFVREILAKTQ